MVGVDVGWYGVFENVCDYDVCVNLMFSMWIGGGVKQCIDQVFVWVDGVDVWFCWIVIEVWCDVSIVWSDFVVLEEVKCVIEVNYIVSCWLCDVLVEWFCVLCGMVFDVFSVESNYFGVVVCYIQIVIEFDISCYILFVCIGYLLDVLVIDFFILDG